MQFLNPRFFYKFLQVLFPSLSTETCRYYRPKPWVFAQTSTLYKLTIWLDRHSYFNAVNFFKSIPLIRRRGFPTRPIPGYDTLADCLENLFILLTYLFTFNLWSLLFWYSSIYHTWVIYTIVNLYFLNLFWSLKVLSTFYLKLLLKKYYGILFYDFSPELKKDIVNSPRNVLEGLWSIYSSFKFTCLIHFFTGQSYFVTSNNPIQALLQQLIALIYWNYKLFSAFPILFIKYLTLFFLILWKGPSASGNLIIFRHPYWDDIYGDFFWEGPYGGFSWRVVINNYSYILSKYLEDVQLLLYDKNVITIYSHDSYLNKLPIPCSFNLQVTRYNDLGDCITGFECSSRHLKASLLKHNLLGFKFLLNNFLLHRLSTGYSTIHIPYICSVDNDYGWKLLPSKSYNLKILNITFPTCLLNLFKLYLSRVLTILIKELKIEDFTLSFNGKRFISWLDLRNQDINHFVESIDSFYIELLPKGILNWVQNQTSLEQVHYLIDASDSQKNLLYNFKRREKENYSFTDGEIKTFSIVFSSPEHLLLFSTYLIDYDPLEKDAFIHHRDSQLCNYYWENLWETYLKWK